MSKKNIDNVNNKNDNENYFDVLDNRIDIINENIKNINNSINSKKNDDLNLKENDDNDDYKIEILENKMHNITKNFMNDKKEYDEIETDINNYIAYTAPEVLRRKYLNLKGDIKEILLNYYDGIEEKNTSKYLVSLVDELLSELNGENMELKEGIKILNDEFEKIENEVNIIFSICEEIGKSENDILKDLIFIRKKLYYNFSLFNIVYILFYIIFYCYVYYTYYNFDNNIIIILFMLFIFIYLYNLFK